MSNICCAFPPMESYHEDMPSPSGLLKKKKKVYGELVAIRSLSNCQIQVMFSNYTAVNLWR